MEQEVERRNREAELLAVTRLHPFLLSSLTEQFQLSIVESTDN
jgi:hypothetical protein